MRKALIGSLIEIATHDPEVVLLSGDLGYGALDQFINTFFDQFINAGIAEQNMTSLAAGLALDGRTVFTYSIGNFNSLRCIEQIRNDIAYHNANVKIISIGEGFSYGSAGMTHHLTEDISIMRAIPNISIFSPSDPLEAKEITKIAYYQKGPCYIRLGKGGEKNINQLGTKIKYGKFNKIKQGKNICFVATGSIINEVMQCEKKLEEEGIFATIYTVPTVKPLDTKELNECFDQYQYIVSVEENNILGGLGSAIAEILSEKQDKFCQLIKIGIKDQFVSVVGSQKYLREIAQIDAESIYGEIQKKCKKLFRG